MAFRHDPVVVGLRPGAQTTSTPRSRIGRSESPGYNGPAQPSGHAVPAPESDDARCRAEYTEYREVAAKTQRRWRWIAAITGVAGLGVGMAVGTWQGGRRASRALPESE